MTSRNLLVVIVSHAEQNNILEVCQWYQLG